MALVISLYFLFLFISFLSNTKQTLNCILELNLLGLPKTTLSILEKEELRGSLSKLKGTRIDNQKWPDGVQNQSIYTNCSLNKNVYADV